MKLKINRNAETIGVVYIHTHTSTFNKIKEVASKATLYCVENRMTVALYVEK